MTSPNLEALLGDLVTKKLTEKAGGLLALTQLSDNALRHLGTEDYAPQSAAATRASQLHTGYLLETPLFKEYFHGEDGDVATGQMKSARKALAQLARKCSLLAKADLSGAAPDGAMGLDELKKLKESFSRLLVEGKVNVVDTQALPAPEVHRRGEGNKKKRGGLKEFKRREAMKEPVSVVEKALSRVRMGVSEEEQRQALLQRADIRVELMKEQQKMISKEKKHQKEEPADEYDDLMDITL